MKLIMNQNNCEQCNATIVQNKTTNNDQLQRQQQQAATIMSITQTCDDTFSNIISFLDFKSAIRFTKLTNQGISSRVFFEIKSNAVTDTTSAHNNSYYNTTNTNAARNKNNMSNDTNNDNGKSFGIALNKLTCYGKNNNDNGNENPNFNHTPNHDHKTFMCFPSMWKEIYLRHHFAPPYPLTPPSSLSPVASTEWNNYVSNYYVNLIEYKRSLLNKLIHTKGKKEKNLSSSSNYIFGLPNSHFSFVPITPNTFKEQKQQSDDQDGNHNNGDDENGDVPPVEFLCTSYIFTSSDTSAEIAYLDPYNGTLSIHDNIINYSQSQQLNQIKNHGDGNEINSNDSYDSKSELQKRNNKGTEALISVQDCANLNIQEYFDFDTPMQPQQQDLTRNNNNDDDDNGIIIDWLGIDSHRIIDLDTNEHVGNMICGARMIILEDPPLIQQFQRQHMVDEDEEYVVTEILAWKKILRNNNGNDNDRSDDNNTNIKNHQQKSYKDGQMICRMNSSPYFIDICPMSNRVFTCFSPDDHVDLNEDVVIVNGNNINDNDHDSAMETQGHTIPSAAYQEDLVGYSDQHSATIHSAEVDGDNDDSDIDDDESVGPPIVSTHDNKIIIYPLLTKEGDNDDGREGSTNLKYFPPVQECIICKHPVTSFMIGPIGERLVVGTENGTIEIWDVSQHHGDDNRVGEGGRQRKGAVLMECIDMTCELRSIQITPSLDAQAKAAVVDVERVSSSLHLYSMMEEEEEEIVQDISTSIDVDNGNDEEACDPELVDECSEMMITGSHIIIDDISIEDRNDTLMEEQDTEMMLSINDELMQTETNLLQPDHDGENDLRTEQCSLSLPQCKSHRQFSSIEIPSHLPIEKAGFVGVQHHHHEGTTLSLWQPRRDGKGFQLTSLINLPLSPQPKPQVHYDGKRIIVFGQDHIGVIILVYKVISTWEDLDYHNDCDETILKNPFSEDSGGVINLCTPTRIEYVNRIRHCGLGGLEYYDNMFMTVNERFIVVNTKTGNLLNPSKRNKGPPRCEGLFVIDLEDFSSTPSYMNN